MAAAFGGSGSQTAFGPRGAQKPLEKATIIAAVLFMVLAMVFSLPGVLEPSSVVREREAATQATPTPSPSPAAPAGAAVPATSPSTSPSPAASPGNK